MGDAEQIVIKVLDRIEQIPAEQWDACAGDDNPFVRHAFLHALEASGCATHESGWAPCHVVLENPDGEVIGAAPLYLKNHSYGEYVFDHGWAAAFERAGGNYYPKLQMSVPFTPATGRRFLCRPGEDVHQVETALLSGCLELAKQFEASSLHITFMTEGEWKHMGEAGMLQRTDQQFHWENRGYQTFDDFLNDLSSRKRKAIRKEREGARAHGIQIEMLTGDDLKPHHWDAFDGFYMDTGSRKWGRPYLNRDFFGRIGETMADQVGLVMCSRDGRYIAGALNMIGKQTLFGRNWGCIEDHRFLHFEACYYQAIDFAIARGLKRVEAGAQGTHKLSRGYMPSETYSAHWIANPGLRDAIDRYLNDERQMVKDDMDALARHAPFKRGP
jgi:uncharacterized protein